MAAKRTTTGGKNTTNATNPGKPVPPKQSGSVPVGKGGKGKSGVTPTGRSGKRGTGGATA